MAWLHGLGRTSISPYRLSYSTEELPDRSLILLPVTVVFGLPRDQGDSWSGYAIG